jgi:hypothetical protein
LNESHVLLRDGTPVLIRRLMAEDAVLYHDFLRVRPNSLSQISRGYKKRGADILVEFGAFAFYPRILPM